MSNRFTHNESKFLHHNAHDMFELVLAVGQYPQFLPWCVGARVTNPPLNETLNGEFIGELMVGFKGYNEKFTSLVTFDRTKLTITTQPQRGAQSPLKFMASQWQFAQHNNGCPKGCIVDFSVECGFQSGILNRAFAQLFDHAISKMVSAFEQRANTIYPNISNDK